MRLCVVALQQVCKAEIVRCQRRDTFLSGVLERLDLVAGNEYKTFLPLLSEKEKRTAGLVGRLRWGVERKGTGGPNRINTESPFFSSSVRHQKKKKK